MQSKQVTCPKCNVVLKVENSRNEAKKIIKCPRCGATLRVNFPPQQEPLTTHTVLVPPQPNPASDGATQLVGTPSVATVLASSQQAVSQVLKLVFNGVDYPLVDGQNIIGRQASTSEASIQLPTSDRYMSRQHCSIRVSTLPNGSKKAVLSNYKNKNATLINGTAVQDDDQIILNDGCQITMGRTTVTFKLS